MWKYKTVEFSNDQYNRLKSNIDEGKRATTSWWNSQKKNDEVKNKLDSFSKEGTERNYWINEQKHQKLIDFLSEKLPDLEVPIYKEQYPYKYEFDHPKYIEFILNFWGKKGWEYYEKMYGEKGKFFVKEIIILIFRKKVGVD